MLRDMVTTRGRVPAMSARSGGQVLKQERVPKRRHSDTAWMVLTKLRVNLGLTIATMVEKPQSAPVKSWIDRTSTQPTPREGWSWALGRGRTVTVGRPSVVWLCGLDG